MNEGTMQIVTSLQEYIEEADFRISKRSGNLYKDQPWKARIDVEGHIDEVLLMSKSNDGTIYIVLGAQSKLTDIILRVEDGTARWLAEEILSVLAEAEASDKWEDE